MKRVMRISTALAGLGLVGLVLGAGCSHFEDDCLRAHDCPVSADGGPPASCIPSKNSAAVADTCGVFVSSEKGSDTTGKGTKAAPFATIGAALDKGSVVYACAGAGGYAEAVAFSKKVSLFGGLDCGTWIYRATSPTKLSADADQVTLTLTSAASGSEVHDFSIAAIDATVSGGSSIAILDDHADVVLENVEIAAGAGKDGAAGPVQDQVQTPTGAGGGDGADNACGSTANAGGTAGQNTCTDAGNSIDTSGGLGGTGSNSASGVAGQDGNPGGTSGKGGKAQDTGGSCDPGAKGADGKPGDAGDGTRGLGDVDASGYHAAAASGGKGPGLAGQGGGGGGGAAKCSGGGSGPGGGGGGAGGCGGAAGKGGQSGGSSIGILALSAKLTLKGVTITTADGGKGGLGGDGQQGAAGGLGGQPGGGNACNGGKGGQGGRGGSGGGGAGGHSAAIAIKGGTLPNLGSATIHHGAGGPGGTGGDGDMTTQAKGDDGHGCVTLDFTEPASPSACVM